MKKILIQIFLLAPVLLAAAESVYICRKCNLNLRTSGRPDIQGCKNNSTHNWHKL